MHVQFVHCLCHVPVWNTSYSTVVEYCIIRNLSEVRKLFIDTMQPKKLPNLSQSIKYSTRDTKKPCIATLYFLLKALGTSTYGIISILSMSLVPRNSIFFLVLRHPEQKWRRCERHSLLSVKSCRGIVTAFLQTNSRIWKTRKLGRPFHRLSSLKLLCKRHFAIWIEDRKGDLKWVGGCSVLI